MRTSFNATKCSRKSDTAYAIDRLGTCAASSAYEATFSMRTSFLSSRTKTQASLPDQDAVALLLFGLLRSGQIKLRALDSYQDMKAVKKAA